MSYMLSNYLQSGYGYVIFDSVVATDFGIRESILRGIKADGYDIIGITLTCSEQALQKRRKKRGDAGEISYYWLRLPPYPGDHVINTDNMSPAAVAAEMKKLLQ